jgi:hypothetical protein
MNRDRNQMENPAALTSSNKKKLEDCKFTTDVHSATFTNHLFVRLVGKDRHFSRIDFRYSTFDACYLRNCTFDSCDFTGCRFVGTNLHGSSFSGCKFDYASFEKTDIDNDILSSGCPGGDNLKLRFARSLRMNYQQLGDAISANKAIGVELEATSSYLHKSWSSNESYYRKKYQREKRIEQFFRWINFKVLDFIWGNGESPMKLTRAVLVVFFAMATVDVATFSDATLVTNYADALALAPQVFLGTVIPAKYPTWYLTLILFARLVFFGFFMSIIVKRFNRR